MNNKIKKVLIMHYPSNQAYIFDYDMYKYKDIKEFFKYLYQQHDLYVSEDNSSYNIVDSDINILEINNYIN